MSVGSKKKTFFRGQVVLQIYREISNIVILVSSFSTRLNLVTSLFLFGCSCQPIEMPLHMKAAIFIYRRTWSTCYKNCFISRHVENSFDLYQKYRDKYMLTDTVQKNRAPAIRHLLMGEKQQQSKSKSFLSYSSFLLSLSGLNNRTVAKSHIIYQPGSSGLSQGLKSSL